MEYKNFYFSIMKLVTIVIYFQCLTLLSLEEPFKRKRCDSDCDGRL